MKLKLVVKTEAHQGLVFSTGQPGSYRIGRTTGVDLALPKDKIVSGQHCQIELTEDGVWIRDHSSHNGTFVNGQRVQEAQLTHGDTLLVGRSAIAVSLSGINSSTVTVEHPVGVPGFTLVKKLPFSGEREIYWAFPNGQPGLVILHLAPIYANPGISNQEVNRLLKQAAITNRLQGHPDILPVRGQGVTGKVMWFATSFVDGEGLDQYVTQSKGLPYQEAVEIVRQAADVLGYVHKSDVVHRSLCPDSLWVSQHGRTLTTYLVDLDSAKWRQIRDLHAMTTIGACGYRLSPFTAPEALTDYTNLDPRSDIYALGAILYFTLTGQAPYVVSEGQDLVTAILEDPPSLSALKPNLPQTIVEVVERAMARNVDTRYGTVEEMRQALVGGPVSPPPPPLSDSLPQIETHISLAPWEKTFLQQLHRGCKKVLVEKEFGGGYSGTRVLQVWPIEKDGPVARRVVKLGPALELSRERDNYEKHVKRHLYFCAARIEGYYEQDNRAGLDYVSVDGGTLGKVVDLEEYYRNTYPNDVNKIIQVLENLLDKGLGYFWYKRTTPSEPCLFATEYSCYMVEYLRLELRQEWPDELWLDDNQPQTASTDYQRIGIETIRDEHKDIKPGTLLTIEGLVVEKIKHGAVKLQDCEGQDAVVYVEHTSGKSIPPELKPNDKVNVRGQVTYNRHGQLAKIVRKAFPDLSSGIDGEFIEMPCEPGMYPNPLTLYPQILKRTLDGEKSRVHGDLHLRNVLVDEGGKGWLIDFADVEKRHNIFDFIQLETYVRLWQLASVTPPLSLCDYVQFEEALNDATLEKEGRVTCPDNSDLQFAYQVILSLRNIARKYMGSADFKNEYFPALFLYCLAMMKYYKNDGIQAARLVFATACVLGRYIQGEDEQGRSAVQASSPSFHVDKNVASTKKPADTPRSGAEWQEQRGTILQGRATMRGIPQALILPLHQVLEKCDQFHKPQQLWEVFSIQELLPWRGRLPEAGSLDERVSRTVGYLVDKRHREKGNVLALFLHILGTHYYPNPADERHGQLLAVAKQLDWYIQRPPKPEATILQANPAAAQMLWTADAEKMLACARAVARIEVPRFRNGKQNGPTTGTAWLVAPDLILTCWHVVEALDRLETSIASSDLQAQMDNTLLTFDYTVAGQGLQYSIAKLEYPTLETKNLDYAVLRLDDRNDAPLRNRGYLRLDIDTPLTAQTSLYIIQHPLGQPEQNAGGPFVRHSPTPGRIL